MLSNTTTSTTGMVVLSAEDQQWRNDVILAVAKETRMPIQRVMMMTWAQFTPPNKIRTQTGREVTLTDLTAHSLQRLPRGSGRWLFTISPFPPIIPDEYLDGARRFVAENSGNKTRRRKKLTIQLV